MNLKEYQQEALQTESKVDQLQFNLRFIRTVFSMYISMTEFMDAVKKQVYYGKSTKMDEKGEQFLYQIDNYIQNIVSMYRDRNHNNVPVDTDPRLFHGILGMATESGELVSVLLKNLAGEPVDPINVQEEMNDSNWYQAIIHDTLGLDWEEGLQRNIDKLQKRRYKSGGFTAAEAENRDLVGERVALEGGHQSP